MTRLSPNFSLEEMTRSNTAARYGVKNVPPSDLMPRLKRTALMMEDIRTICGDRPVIVFSCYRSEVVNRLVGGSPTSSHKDADAVDFKILGLSITETIKLIRESRIEFDQLIDEFNSWVHVGFGPRERGQVLSARKRFGKTVYSSL